MNNSLIASLIFGILSTPLFGESIYERELKQLTEKRDKELATATKPINLSYQAALQNLLLRASKNNDAAIPAIADALKTIGVAAATPTSADSSASTKAKRIEDLLTSKVWLHRNYYHYKFTKEGRVHVVEQDIKGKFQIDGKTGSVSFIWENSKETGAGIKFDEGKGTFALFNGEAFVPVTK